jgi:hypothetical protein
MCHISLLTELNNKHATTINISLLAERRSILTGPQSITF